MSLNELADYIETKLCRESVFIVDPFIDDGLVTHVKFPEAISGQHPKYNDRYSTMYAAFVNRDAHGDVDYIRVCDFKPTFYDNGLLRSYSYEYHCVSDSKNINLQKIDRMIEHDIALADALYKCREIDAQTELLQEIEKL